jgi:ATP-dependent Lon protease
MKKPFDIIVEMEKAEKDYQSIPKKLTILPLRDNIIFPYMIFPVLIGRSSSLKAVAEAVEKDKFIFVTAQKNSDTEEPGFEDIYKYGTTAKIIQVLKLPNNLLKVLVEGLFVSKIKRKFKSPECLHAVIERVPIKAEDTSTEFTAIVRHTSNLFANYVKNNSKLPQDLISAFENIEDPERKLYFAAANINEKIEVMQTILEQKSLKAQYFKLSTILAAEIELMQIEQEVDEKVSNTIQQTQRKFYIQEQIRVLQDELGEDEEASPDIAVLREAIEKAGMPEAVKTKAKEELDKLKKIPPMSPEYTVNRTYIEWLTQVPWSKKTTDNLNIEHVKKILDEDHYDLEKPKERITEFIAILNLAGTIKRQILCFVGPPGVGKTSLGRSIARALNREFVRFSLGGIRDEAEIRGHRRTYIGALPGKIIQSMKKAGTTNPVILLDEIDKMSMDFRGDPSSALLEVLDPEQNIAFNDHYLEVDYDLSNVLFITTANVQYDIPLPLQDRMEIIHLNSYLEPEKLEIAKRHIIPKLLKEFKLDNLNISFTDKAIHRIIREYTREAGVRNLERELAAVLRKLAKEIVQNYYSKKNIKEAKGTALYDNPDFLKSIKRRSFKIDEKKITKYLKKPRYKDRKEKLIDKTGVATGLAWTSVGGEILPIEVTIMSGSEKLILTGKLGDVMKESARAALSYIRANSKLFNIDPDFFVKKEIHIHIPEGAIPKDGPSAGITMATALISAATNMKVAGDVAMTGEITLRGNILPIGGLNEKLLAAKRIGIKTVLIPFDNKNDIDEINEYVKKGLDIIPIKTYKEAIPYVFRNYKTKSGKSKK